METAADAWAGLTEAWRLCFSLAWEGYGAGSAPVGAVVVDGNEEVVATGRNRARERAGPAGQLVHTSLAHAEVNALAGLDASGRYRDHVLYTTHEPCMMCVGAAQAATVGEIRYAGAAPYRGMASHRTLLAAAEVEPLPLHGPRDDEFGCLASALLFAFYLEHPATSREPMAALEREVPHAAAAGRSLMEMGARELAVAGVAMPEALPTVWPALLAR